MTRAEAIISALINALTNPAMASVSPSAIYRDLIGAIDQGNTLALVVEEGDESAPQYDTISSVERTVEISLSAIAKGSMPYSRADAPLLEAHNRIMADRELGGLSMDIQEGQTTRQRDSLDRAVGIVTKTYRVVYRTSADSLE